MRCTYGLTAFLCAVIGLAQAAETAPQTTRPNIVFILLDDLDKVATAPFYPEVLPSALSLAEQGITFDNAFVTTPICCPSRASILSGRYGHNTEVLTNGGRYGGRTPFLDDEISALPALLHRRGYRNGIFGKYLNGFEQKRNGSLPSLPYGWHEGHVFTDRLLKSYTGYNYQMLDWKGASDASGAWSAPQKLVAYGKHPSDYSTDVIAAAAKTFITKEADKNAVFFAFLAPTCPHFPLPPAPRHKAKTATRWSYESFPTGRASYYCDETADHSGGEKKDACPIPKDKPRWLQDTWTKRQWLQNYGARLVGLFGGDVPTLPKGKSGWNQAEWYNRMGSLYACDEFIADIEKTLKHKGIWENTLVIITSDNGYNLGAHGLTNKMAPYEESIGVPLWISGGVVAEKRRGSHETRWVQHIDFAPTILELAGEVTPSFVDGQSFASILRGEQPPKASQPEEILIEYVGGGYDSLGIGMEFPKLLFKYAPPMGLDLPSYRGLRARIILPGEASPKTVLFVEWNGAFMPGDKQYQQVEYELYDLDRDPMQLDNLLFSAPAAYEPVKNVLLARLKQRSTCKGASCRAK